MNENVKVTITHKNRDTKQYVSHMDDISLNKSLSDDCELLLILRDRSGKTLTEFNLGRYEDGKKEVINSGNKSPSPDNHSLQQASWLKKMYSSEKFNELINSIILATNTKMSVLLTGETGVGKEFIAQTIHKFGVWADKPFVAVNCGAIPENLLESELFGYETGAFTGAKKEGKPGKFELAGDGIIFLDEISEIPVNLQVKLLRVLQERQFERVGGVKPIKMNAKIITASNRNLEFAIQNNLFRLDLYYRISVMKIHLPPLREHREDIPEIANICIERINRSYLLDVSGLSEETIRVLQKNDWTGNIRELSNVLEYAANMAQNGDIQPAHLPIRRDSGIHGTEYEPLNKKLEDIEREEMVRALKESGGSRTKAAELLQMTRSTFYNKLKKYDL